MHTTHFSLASWRQGSGLLAIALTLSAASTQAGNWPQWRGPELNGSCGETNLPIRWSQTNGFAWKTPLPGKSGATPIVWDNYVFVPSPDAEKNLKLFCIDLKTGKILWQNIVGKGDRTSGKNNMASPSAITDGKRVYALFGTGDFAAFDFSGKEVWHRHLNEDYGAFALMFLYGSSPLLYDGKLYMELLQHNPPQYPHAVDKKTERHSYLICFDPETGKTLWQKERNTGAQDESMEAYTTPMPCADSKGKEIIVVGADWVTSHRPDNGEEIWRYPNLNPKKRKDARIVPSPLVMPGRIAVCSSKRETLSVLKADASGVTDESQIVWKTREAVPDVCTPLYYQGKMFVLDGDKQVLTCYNPTTGQKIWQGHLGVSEVFSASPTGADGKIYCLSEDGTVVITSAGDHFEILNTIPMGEGPSASSIVAANGIILVRTAENLYCIQPTADNKK